MISTCNALSFYNITINTSTSNTSLTFDTITLTSQTTTIDDNFIYLDNISYTNGNLTANYINNYNHSIANNNLDSSEFPFINYQDNTTLRMTSSLDSTINATLKLYLGFNINNLTYTSHTGAYNKTYNSSEYVTGSGYLTFDVIGLEPGNNNTLLFNETEAEEEPAAAERTTDLSPILVTVTACWVFLAYTVRPQFFKEVLYWFVFGNMVLMTYVIYGIGKSENLIPQVTENYLVIQLLMCTAYFMIYFITWIMQMLKKRKVDNSVYKND